MRRHSMMQWVVCGVLLTAFYLCVSAPIELDDPFFIQFFKDGFEEDSVIKTSKIGGRKNPYTISQTKSWTSEDGLVKQGTSITKSEETYWSNETQTINRTVQPKSRDAPS